MKDIVFVLSVLFVFCLLGFIGNFLGFIPRKNTPKKPKSKKVRSEKQRTLVFRYSTEEWAVDSKASYEKMLSVERVHLVKLSNFLYILKVTFKE